MSPYTSEEYNNLYCDENLLTDVLSEHVMHNIINPNRAMLRAADNRYCLDNLLYAMLEDAPHPLGQRYVAVTLHIAHQQGEDGVVDAAKAWMDNLFLPILAISKAIKSEFDSGQSPIYDYEEVQHIESASQRNHHILSDKVARREQYRCAVSGAFDSARVEELLREGHGDEIPQKAQQFMQGAYIMPFLLHKLDEPNLEITDPGCTLDMLSLWTCINFETLCVNSPTNAIYMTNHEHTLFRCFRFYLDKKVYPNNPNKYKVHMVRESTRMSNGLREPDVEFPILEDDPPNPDYIKVHASFAKVLHLSRAVDYVESVEMGIEVPDPSEKMDFASSGLSESAAIAY